jgi:hypothetical protein
MRTQQLQTKQDYYSAKAAIEFAKGQIYSAGNPDPIPTRYFQGHAFNITRTSGKINVTTTEGSATNTYSITDPSPSFCIYSLVTSGNNAVDTNNSSSISIPSCRMAINSSGTKALELAGSSNITASAIQIVGNYNIKNTATITSTVTTGATAVTDPLASYSMPTYSTCDFTNTNLNNTTTTINPGTYCGGLIVRGTSVVTMNPGTYIIDGSNNLEVRNTATLTGTNVAVILGGTISGNYARVNVQNDGILTLTAPTTGTYAGIAIFQDRNATQNQNNTISGSSPGGRTIINGIIYLPNQNLEYQNSTIGSGTCTKVIVYKLKLSGSATFGCT